MWWPESQNTGEQVSERHLPPAPRGSDARVAGDAAASRGPRARVRHPGPACPGHRLETPREGSASGSLCPRDGTLCLGI